MSRCTIRLACAWATASSDVEEQAQARLDVESRAVAVAVDRLALDVLEHEVGLAGRRHAGVEELRDVRVGEAGRGCCPRAGSAPRRRGRRGSR